jgi:hypothetical protein
MLAPGAESGAGGKKNPAELPASRPNSGAGTEKRPFCNTGVDNNVGTSRVKYKNQKI